jgi:hypothetical protein
LPSDARSGAGRNRLAELRCRHGGARILSTLLILLLSLVAPLSWAPAQGTAAPATETLDAAAARQRVIDIVNQPVTHLPRTAEAGIFSPGWFHDGAIKPDFNNVDVRATQEFTYDSSSYVTSDLNPSEMFVGRDLEFNAMTKYFYTDRTLPKKRLSEAEMLEINRLYRIIGRDEHAVAMRWLMAGSLVLALLLAASFFLLVRRPR